MPTYISRRSSSSPPSSTLASCGRLPSSQPITKTVRNSRPLAACRLIRRTALPGSPRSAFDSRASCAASSPGPPPRAPSNHEASSSRLALRRRKPASSLHWLRTMPSRPLRSASTGTSSAGVRRWESSRSDSTMRVNSSSPAAARGVSCLRKPICPAARDIGMPAVCAIAASFSSVVAPTSRLGAAIARRKAVSSSGLASTRSQLSRSLTSARSRKAVPPVR